MADPMAGIRSRHQQEDDDATSSSNGGLREALVADARVTALHRGERHEFRGALDRAVQMLRLAWVSDAFLAQALYRLKARLQALGVPVLPRLAHRLAMALAQVSIGDPVVVQPGVYIVHGQVVVDGLVEIDSRRGDRPVRDDRAARGRRAGATIERDVSIGTGAKVIGAGAHRRRGARSARTRSSSTTSRRGPRWSARRRGRCGATERCRYLSGALMVATQAQGAAWPRPRGGAGGAASPRSSG